jgi:hypothetical protein
MLGKNIVIEDVIDIVVLILHCTQRKLSLQFYVRRMSTKLQFNWSQFMMLRNQRLSKESRSRLRRCLHVKVKQGTGWYAVGIS